MKSVQNASVLQSLSFATKLSQNMIEDTNSSCRSYWGIAEAIVAIKTMMERASMFVWCYSYFRLKLPANALIVLTRRTMYDIQSSEYYGMLSTCFSIVWYYRLFPK